MQIDTTRSMKRFVSLLLIPVFALALSGCFHAEVTTDKQPSGQTIEKPWATGFLFGLAMPGAKIDAAQQCSNGVAKVETKQSFLNGLAAGFTFNLYTPMSVTITCAAGGSMSSVIPPPDFEVPSDVDEIETAEVLHSAALESARTNKPIRVKMD
ncbi:MAG: hypothetical protein BRD26_07330 [Bacteroidetes bacterium QH_1_64_81]|nr:MAG: hypothetical protein BRD26_07330 [Bacteroidetes bacterium QH_1_64_81]